MAKVERLVAVDPGLRECGVAVFENGKLVFAKLVTAPHRREGATQWSDMALEVKSEVDLPVDRMAVEQMEVRKTKTSAWKDIMQLAHVAGGIFALFALKSTEVISVKPSRWTQGRPKQANHVRIRSRLNRGETRALTEGLEETPSANHKELLDAVGIGLYVLRRL